MFSGRFKAFGFTHKEVDSPAHGENLKLKAGTVRYSVDGEAAKLAWDGATWIRRSKYHNMKSNKTLEASKVLHEDVLLALAGIDTEEGRITDILVSSDIEC